MNPVDFLTEDMFQESYRVAQRSVERAQNHKDSISESHYEWHERSSYTHPNWPRNHCEGRLERSRRNADEAVKQAKTHKVRILNDWGIKLSIEGKHQEAIDKFDEAIQYSVDDAMRNKVEHCKNLAIQESKEEFIQQLDHLRIGHRWEDVSHEIKHEINDMQNHRNWVRSRSETYWYDCGHMGRVPRSNYFFSWNDTKEGWIPDIRFKSSLFEHDSSMADCGLYNAKINKAIILDILDRKLCYKIRSNEQYQESIKKFNTACDGSVSSEGKAMYQNNMANALKDLANKLRGQELYSEALTKYKEAVTKYTKACNVRVNEEHKAIYKNNKALALNDWGNALKDLANELRGQKLHSEALKKCNEAITKYDEACAVTVNEEHKAIFQNNKVLALNDCGNVLNAWGASLRGEGEYKEAIAKFNEACNVRVNEEHKAIYKNNKALALNDWGNALKDLANELRGRKLYNEAFEKYNEALAKYAEAYDTAVNEEHRVIYKSNKALVLNAWGNVLKDSANKLYNQKLHTDAVIKFNEDFTKHEDLANKLRSEKLRNAALAKYTEAVTKYDEACDITVNEEHKAIYQNSKAFALNGLGNVLKDLANELRGQKLHSEAFKKYNEALAKYDEALGRATKDSTKDVIGDNKAIMLNDWAITLRSQKLYKDALIKFNEACGITVNEEHKAIFQDNEALGLNDCGNALKDLANKLRSEKLHHAALAKYDEALNRATKDSTKDIVRNDKAAMLNDWANELVSQKLYDDAKSKLLEALSIAKSENIKNELKESLFQILNKVIKGPANATSQETGQNTDESSKDSMQLVDVKNENTQVEKLGGARCNLGNALDDDAKTEVIDRSVIKSVAQDKKVSTKEVEGRVVEVDMIRELIDQITQSKNELFSIDPHDSDFKDIYLRFQQDYSDLRKARKQIADSNVSADELNNVLTESKDLIFKIERLDKSIIGDTFTIE